MADELAHLRKRCAQLELLNQVSHVIHSTLEPEKALNLILHQAVQLTAASSASVILINPNNNRLEIQASHGLTAEVLRLKLRVGQGITGWVARTGEPALVGNVKEDRRYVCVRENALSELAVPLRVNGEVRGVINVDSDRQNAFSAEDQERLEALAAQAAGVIHNTWLYAQIRHKARMFEGLSSVSRTINSTLSLDDVLQVIVSETCALMGAKVCALHLLDESHEWFDLRACHGAGSSYLNKPRLSAEESLLGIALRRRKPIQIEDIQVSSRYLNQSVARDEGLVALLSVPLVFSDKATGVISVYKGTGYIYSDEEIRVLQSLAELSGVAIEKARLYERIVEVEDQLRQNERLSALGLLAAEVAHEIRNPLTVLKMLFHSLNLDFPLEDPRAKDVEVMGNKLNQLNRIVERIMNFARDAEPNVAPVSVNKILGELALVTRHKLHQHQVRLVQNLDECLPDIEADSIQLEQAFLNLILNAVQAMPDGGTLTLRSRFVQREDLSGDGIELEFTDTGEGMSEAQRQQAFTSILNSTKRGGTGLGLAIVKKVVETHKGKITIESAPGKGTSICIALPCHNPNH